MSNSRDRLKILADIPEHSIIFVWKGATLTDKGNQNIKGPAFMRVGRRIGPNRIEVIDKNGHVYIWGNDFEIRVAKFAEELALDFMEQENPEDFTYDV